MKLVLMTHQGIVDSDIWLKCQRKLEKNRQITNSFSNPTSWLAGKVICEKCGHTMTTIKGKANREGQVRRYFNCTGKSHKRSCTGPKVSIYAEDLENMVYDCIAEKLSELREPVQPRKNCDPYEVNELKLKIKSIERSEQQLIDAVLSGGFNGDLLVIANKKATQLENDRLALCKRLESLQAHKEEAGEIVNFARSWQSADYSRKKAVAMIMIHKIIIAEDGVVNIEWNI